MVVGTANASGKRWGEAFCAAVLNEAITAFTSGMTPDSSMREKGLFGTNGLGTKARAGGGERRGDVVGLPAETGVWAGARTRGCPRADAVAGEGAGEGVSAKPGTSAGAQTAAGGGAWANPGSKTGLGKGCGTNTGARAGTVVGTARVATGTGIEDAGAGIGADTRAGTDSGATEGPAEGRGGWAKAGEEVVSTDAGASSFPAGPHWMHTVSRVFPSRRQEEIRA